MQDIADLEGRLATALERIGRGLDGLEARRPPPEPEPERPDLPDAEVLMSELQAEREVTTQLEARLAAIRDKGEARRSAAEADLDKARALIDALDKERGRLRESNEALRNANAALLEAQEGDAGKPQLMAAAAAAEIEGLKAARAADRAELDQLLAILEDDEDEDEEEAADA